MKNSNLFHCILDEVAARMNLPKTRLRKEFFDVFSTVVRDFIKNAKAGTKFSLKGGRTGFNFRVVPVGRKEVRVGDKVYKVKKDKRVKLNLSQDLNDLL